MRKSSKILEYFWEAPSLKDQEREIPSGFRVLLSCSLDWERSLHDKASFVFNIMFVTSPCTFYTDTTTV